MSIVTTETLIADLQALVRIDSQNPGPMEAGVAAWLTSRLDRPGISLVRQRLVTLAASAFFTFPAGGGGVAFLSFGGAGSKISL